MIKLPFTWVSQVLGDHGKAVNSPLSGANTDGKQHGRTALDEDPAKGGMGWLGDDPPSASEPGEGTADAGVRTLPEASPSPSTTTSEQDRSLEAGSQQRDTPGSGRPRILSGAPPCASGPLLIPSNPGSKHPPVQGVEGKLGIEDPVQTRHQSPFPGGFNGKVASGEASRGKDTLRSTKSAELRGIQTPLLRVAEKAAQYLGVKKASPPDTSQAPTKADKDVNVKTPSPKADKVVVEPEVKPRKQGDLQTPSPEVNKDGLEQGKKPREENAWEADGDEVPGGALTCRKTEDFTRAGLLTPEAVAAAMRSLSLEAGEKEHAPAEPAAVGLVYDPVMELHVPRGNHVECPERTSALVKRLKELGLQDRCSTIAPRAATDEELRRVHTLAHIAAIDSGEKYPDPDIYVSEGSALAARTAAGCCVEAVDAVLSGRCRASFAVVRPPGHHAECQRAMGFCMYNNTAIAALAAQQQCGGRVLLLDWDVHHGNGIQNVLYDNPDIMYISIHRGAGFYPGTGQVKGVGGGEAAGCNINIPWPRGGFGDADYMATFELVVEPIIAQFAPEIIIVSAGFDAAEGDPLGGMSLSPAGYAHMTLRLQKLAKEGRMVLALEGGYNIGVTANCAAACVAALLGDAAPEMAGRAASCPRRETRDVLAEVADAHRPFWPAALPAKFSQAWDDYCLAHNFQRSARVSKTK